jgi:hypothetical protein
MADQQKDPGETRRRAQSLSIRGTNPLDNPLTTEEFQLGGLCIQINRQREEEERVEKASQPLEEPRRRARSLSFNGPNPLDNPLTAEEYQLAALRTKINREREDEERVKKQSNPRSAGTSSVPWFPTRSDRPPLPVVSLPKKKVDTIPDRFWQQTLKKTAEWFIPSNKGKGNATPNKGKATAMNYQNYIDSPGGGPGANPRQAPPSPSQGMNHTNGMNGGVGMGGGMVGYPTPAGHQSDLNYVMSMVEELSAVLRQNQQLTANVVEKMGKVREKASTMNLTNDELVAVVAAELNGKSLRVHFHRSI